MSALKWLAFLISFLVFSVPAELSADDRTLWGELKPGPHGVGFQVETVPDPTRTFPVMNLWESEEGHGEGPRQVRVYLWYPAEPGDLPPLAYRSYLACATRDFPGRRMHERLGEAFDPAIPILRGLSGDRLKALLDTPCAARRDGPAKKGSFPVILFGQGLYYESPVTHAVLCEYLASHGYVVATCPLMGTRSRWVRLDNVDLETQVRDLEFVLARARAFENAHPEDLGLVGFDMGGMSCLVLAMRNASVDAFVSLDAGILFRHPSALPSTSPHYSIDRFCIPWMHMTRTKATEGIPADAGIDNLFEKARYCPRHLLLFDRMGHVGFTSYAMIDKEPVPRYWGPAVGDGKKRYEAVCAYTLHFLDHCLAPGPESSAFLDKDPAEAVPGVSMTKQYKAGEAAPHSLDNFVNLVFEEGVEAAVARARSLKAGGYATDLLDEGAVNALGYKFLYFWGDADKALAIFQLNVEFHPGSANVYDSLGEACLAKGLREEAIRNYRKSLNLNPGNDNAAKMLKRLGE